MIDEYKKDYLKGKRIVKRIFLVLIFISLLLIGIKLLKEIGGVVLFPVKQVIVYGNRYVGSKDVIKLLGIGPTTSILNINRSKSSEILREDPRIETAVIVKVYPDTVKVYLKEKSMLLPLKVGDNLYALSSDGVVLGRITNSTGIVSPILQILNYDDIKIGYKLDNFLVQETLKTIQKLVEDDNNFFKEINQILIRKSGVYLNLNNSKYSVYLGDNISPEVLKRLKALITIIENSKEAERGKSLIINMSFSHAAVKIRE